MNEEEKPETLADIVAEMRKRAKAVYEGSFGGSFDCPPECEPTIDPIYDVHDWSDRIEAAAKRELDDAERRGHHAAMSAVCETLEKVRPELAPGRRPRRAPSPDGRAALGPSPASKAANESEVRK